MDAGVPWRDSEKCLLPTFTMTGKSWCLNSAIWKKYGSFCKRRAPNAKTMCLPLENNMWIPNFPLQKAFYVWSRKGGQEEGAREGKEEKGKKEKTDVSLKIFQAWITETVFNLFKIILWSLRGDWTGFLSATTRFISTLWVIMSPEQINSRKCPRSGLPLKAYFCLQR